MTGIVCLTYHTDGFKLYKQASTTSRKKKNEQWQTRPRGDTGDWWFFIFPSTGFGSSIQHGPMSSEMTEKLKPNICCVKVQCRICKASVLFFQPLEAWGRTAAAAAHAEGAQFEGRGVNSISWVRKRVKRSEKEMGWGFWLGFDPQECWPSSNNAFTWRKRLKAWMLMCPWWFWKERLALIVCKHVYYQQLKYLRKSNKSALGGSVNPKDIGVKLGMGRSTDHLTVT